MCLHRQLISVLWIYFLWAPRVSFADPQCSIETGAGQIDLIDCDTVDKQHTHCVIDKDGVPGGCALPSHAACADSVTVEEIQCLADFATEGCCCLGGTDACNSAEKLKEFCGQGTNQDDFLVVCPPPTTTTPEPATTGPTPRNWKDIQCYKLSESNDDVIETCSTMGKGETHCKIDSKGRPAGCTRWLNDTACKNVFGSSITCGDSFETVGCCCEPDPPDGLACNDESGMTKFCDSSNNRDKFSQICSGNAFDANVDSDSGSGRTMTPTLSVLIAGLGLAYGEL